MYNGVRNTGLQSPWTHPNSLEANRAPKPTRESFSLAKIQHSVPKQKQADKNYIAVMGKIFAVLEYFVERSDDRHPIAFSEISNDLPLSRSTVHRILYSLEKLGYLEKDQASHYYLAAKYSRLTSPRVHFQRLHSVVVPVMQQLLVRHAETVSLGAIEN